MNSKDNNPSNDPLDALTDWDQRRSSVYVVQAPAIHAGDVVQALRNRQRRRAITVSSIVLTCAGVFVFVGINSWNRPNSVQPEVAIKEAPKPVPKTIPNAPAVPIDSLIAEFANQPDATSEIESVNQHLAVVESSLSGFRQLREGVVRLNAIDRSSNQQQYQLERNLAMLEVLKSALPNTN